MTDGLKALLEHLGKLAATIAHLHGQRPGSDFATLDEYYAELGPPLPGEPVLLVKVSKDGETKFTGSTVDASDPENGAISIFELAEDDFWFFRAFRPAIFELERDLPPFIYEMSVVNTLAVFEGYLSDVLRARLHLHPRLMEGGRTITYEQVIAAESKSDLLSAMIDREIREVMFMSLADRMKRLRRKLGFRGLTDKYDDQAVYWTLVRNCVLHNRSLVSPELARARSDLRVGAKILLNLQDVTHAILVFGRFAGELDRIFEARKAM